MTTERKSCLQKYVLQPNKIKQITTQQFLEALSHDKKYFRTFGGNSPDYNGGRNYGPYSHDEVEYFLKPFNEQEHRDCFVIVNDGGHKGADITRAVGQYMDFDAGRNERYLDEEGKWHRGSYLTTEEVEEKKKQFRVELKAMIADGIIPEPSIIVETRNGYHVYWLYNYDNAVEMAVWKAIQKSMIAFFKDSITALDVDNIHDYSRVMRVPNMMWYKCNEDKEPFQIRVRKFNPEIRYADDTLGEVFPYNMDDTKHVCTSSRKSGKRTPAGMWWVKFADREVIQVDAFDEGGQLHAACPLCPDPAGHDIVITEGGTSDYWAYCNSSGCTHTPGGFATQNEDEVYDVKNAKKAEVWKEIDKASAYDDLTPEMLEVIKSYMEYKDDNRTVEEWFQGRLDYMADSGYGLDAMVNTTIDASEVFGDDDNDDPNDMPIPNKDKDENDEWFESDNWVENSSSAWNIPDDDYFDDNPDAVGITLITVSANVRVNPFFAYNVDEYLDKKFGKKLKYPLHIFPTKFKKYVENAMLQKGVPAEYIANGVMVIFCGAMNTKHFIQMEEGWGQYPILWVIIMAVTGSKKTTCFNVCWKPAEDLILKTQESNKLSAKTFLKDKALFEKDPANKEFPSPPTKRVLHLSDTNYQYLTDLNAHSPHGTTLTSDEVLGSIMGLAEMSKGSIAERSYVLGTWDGLYGLAGRKGYGELYVNHRMMNLFGFAQPSKFKELLVLEKNTADGFLPRMLMINIPERRMPRKNIPIDPQTFNDIKNAITELENEPAEYLNKDKTMVKPILHYLDAPAQEYWEELELEDADVREAFWQNKEHWFKPYYSKIQAHRSRFALAIHMIHKKLGGRNSEKVSLKTLKDAVKLTDYFLSNTYQFIRFGKNTHNLDKYQDEYDKLCNYNVKYNKPYPVSEMVNNKVFANTEIRDEVLQYLVVKGAGSIIELSSKGKRGIKCFLKTL